MQQEVVDQLPIVSSLQMTLGEFDHQAVYFGSRKRPGRSDITQAMREWYIHIQTQGILNRGKHAAFAPLGVWRPFTQSLRNKQQTTPTPQRTHVKKIESRQCWYIYLHYSAEQFHICALITVRVAR